MSFIYILLGATYIQWKEIQTGQKDDLFKVCLSSWLSGRRERPLRVHVITDPGGLFRESSTSADNFPLGFSNAPAQQQFARRSSESGPFPTRFKLSVASPLWLLKWGFLVSDAHYWLSWWLMWVGGIWRRRRRLHFPFSFPRFHSQRTLLMVNKMQFETITCGRSGRNKSHKMCNRKYPVTVCGTILLLGLVTDALK